MPVVSPSRSGGGPAAGSYLPVAAPTGATLDTTTYDNTITGVGKLATLVFPAAPGDTAALAIANVGDAFPRWLMTSIGNDGVWAGDGTFDPYSNSAGWECRPGGGLRLFSKPGQPIDAASPATTPAGIPFFAQLSPVTIITSGALPTVALVSGAGTQIQLAPVGGGRDVETVTPVTFNPGAATTATCAVALSPDNVTYSTLGVVTEPVGVAFDGTIHLVKVRVPAGWYLKLTVNAQAVLGTTTYY